MSNLQIIEQLCGMLKDAQAIIKGQAELLAMHGIQTEGGKLETKWNELLANIEKST